MEENKPGEVKFVCLRNITMGHAITFSKPLPEGMAQVLKLYFMEVKTGMFNARFDYAGVVKIPSLYEYFEYHDRPGAGRQNGSLDKPRNILKKKIANQGILKALDASLDYWLGTVVSEIIKGNDTITNTATCPLCKLFRPLNTLSVDLCNACPVSANGNACPTPDSPYNQFNLSKTYESALVMVDWLKDCRDNLAEEIENGVKND